MSERGIFVVSLDFEMMWGCHDWATPDGYGTSNVRQVRMVIDRMLDLFTHYGIHATFAPVGLLMCSNLQEARRHTPSQPPQYANPMMSPFREGYMDSITTENAPLYFAPDIIEKLRNTEGIELGTHTFSHFYCWEPGQDVGQFACDIRCAMEIGKDKTGNAPSSIIFPKNNVGPEYLRTCASMGLKTFRGNPAHFFDNVHGLRARTERILRLADCYFPIVDNLHPFSEIKKVDGLTNIPASRFLRPYSRLLGPLEPLRLHRIKKEMRRAASKGMLYHLWWHPHNFGADPEKNLRFLEQILREYSRCCRKYGMMSLNMGEAAELFSKCPKAPTPHARHGLMSSARSPVSAYCLFILRQSMTGMYPGNFSSSPPIISLWHGVYRYSL